MAYSPFKMKGFSGFKSSPMKQATDIQSMIDAKKKKEEENEISEPTPLHSK